MRVRVKYSSVSGLRKNVKSKLMEHHDVVSTSVPCSSDILCNKDNSDCRSSLLNLTILVLNPVIVIMLCCCVLVDLAHVL